MRRSLRGGSTLLLLDGSWAPGPTLCFPSWTETGNYTCEFCGKQYKYYTPYQEHVALHAPISEYLLLLGEGGGPATGLGSGVLLGEGESKGELGLGWSLISSCDLGAGGGGKFTLTPAARIGGKAPP